MSGILEDKDENEVFVPPAVLHGALEAVNKVMPAKSKHTTNFCEWRKRKHAKGLDEKIILAYISERSKNAKSSSLWSYYSQLKKMLSVKENIDISRFLQVSVFLKQSVGHRAKKFKVFTLEEMERFLDTASDEEYLQVKVVLIVGVFGGCRIGELVAMSVHDVDDRGSVIVVEILDTITHKPRIFTIINGSNSVPAIDVFRKYRILRPENISHKRLFISYRNKKCNAVQPVGVNTFSKFPQKIAQFLGLQNLQEYTGHIFRRSSATLLADSGPDLTVVKRHGGWRSNSVVEGYIEDSHNNKIEISRQIMNQSSTITKNGSASDSPACSSASNSVSNIEINHQGINLPIHRRFDLNFNNCK